jgi:hypothetical protein
MGLRERGDAFRGAEAAAVGDVELADLDGAFLEHVFEGLEVRHALAAGHGRGERGVDLREAIDASGQQGSSKK